MTSSDDSSATSDDRPATSDDSPTTSDDRPATSDDSPTTSDDSPASTGGDPPIAPDDQSVGADRHAPSSRGDEPTVLLVEDNRGDVALVEHAFEVRDLPGTLRVVDTGPGAIDWIAARGEHADAPRPDLVLLDLNLPGTSGIEVLEEISGEPATRPLPVVVLTSSKSPGELSEAYGAGANACVRKPVDPEEFAARIEAVIDFWLETATLPTARVPANR